MTIPQFMIYHLHEWDAEKQKYKKKPVGLQGEPLITGQGIPTSPDRAAVVGTINSLNGDNPQQPYRLGLWLYPGCGFFFLDLDEDAVDPATSLMTTSGWEFAAPLVQAGCYFEASTSGRGAHVIGRYHGLLPPHAVQRPLSAPAPHALYTEGRGCVLSEAHTGSWDVDATEPLITLLRTHFPPRAAAEGLRAVSDAPRPEWRGPADDDQLITRMLGASGSALGRLTGKVPLRDLWEGKCSHDNESDFALAAHLAFWTGCAASRMERLMRRSPLAAYRSGKWDSHSTYLRELTIEKACATTSTVYVEPQRVDTAAAILGVARAPLQPLAPPPAVAPAAPAGLLPGMSVVTAAADWHDMSDERMHAINSAGNLRELDTIMQSIGGYGWPALHGERIVTTLQAKLEMFGAKQTVARLRGLVMPPVEVSALALQEVPEWAEGIVYVLQSDSYFDTSTATEYSAAGVRATFARNMPMKATGVREDPIQWLQERWNMRTVSATEYRPDMPAVFDFEGRSYANQFLPASMPVPVFGTPECAACIDLFKAHLMSYVNFRPEIYAALMGWIAHNVQRPGTKIRWSPLIQGSGGDGKSIIGTLFRSAIGSANVKMTSTSTLNNSGGFTDWAIGAAVNIIEEMKLADREANSLYNVMKTFLGDDTIEVNKKGKAAGRSLVNITNHIALTNFRNASPIADGDRRLCVIFAPWGSADEAARFKGLANADDLPPFFERLANSMKAEPGAWRAWLMGIDLSNFNPNGRAPMTAEKEAMKSGAENFVEQTIRDAITAGGSGITREAFSSRLLMRRVEMLLGEKPDNRSWNRLLSDLGYHQHPEQIWWNSQSNRVWLKKSMTKDEILQHFTESAFSTPN